MELPFSSDFDQHYSRLSSGNPKIAASPTIVINDCRWFEIGMRHSDNNFVVQIGKSLPDPVTPEPFEVFVSAYRHSILVQMLAIRNKGVVGNASRYLDGPIPRVASSVHSLKHGGNRPDV